MELVEAMERAKKQLSEVTGLKPVSATRAFQDERGWHIGIEMLEMSRIPTATDLLGYYEVIMDGGCTMLQFERKSTRLRGEPRSE